MSRSGVDGERWILRIFSAGGRSVHAGPISDYGRACRRAEQIAKRCRRRGLSVSVTVRPLLAGATAIEDLIDSVAERGSFHVGSYAGVPEREGDGVDQLVARAILERGGGVVALLPGDVRV